MTVNVNSECRSVRLRIRNKLGTRLLFWFLLLAMVPLTTVSIFNYYQANASLHKAAVDALQSTSIIKTSFLSSWFDNRFLDLRSQVFLKPNGIFLSELRSALRVGDKSVEQFVGSYQWALIVDEHDVDLKALRRTYGYDDILLMDTEGNILFSVIGKSELGTNLFSGRYSHTLFADACRRSLETGQQVFSDLEFYAPSNNDVAGFLVSPLVDRQGDKIGLMAFQIGTDEIDAVLKDRTGLGATGETYLVGPDYMMRSNSVHRNYPTTLVTEVRTPATELWYAEHIAHTKETHDKELVLSYMGPNGKRAIGAHAAINIGGVRWAIISEVAEDEAFAAATRLGFLSVGFVIVTLILITLIVVPISRSIVKPIEALSRIARLAAEDKYSDDILVRSNDEVGALTASFNHMLKMRHLYEDAMIESNGQAQRALADLAEQKFALDQHSIVVITDVDGNITFVNDKFVEISGYRREELLGQNHRIMKSGHHDTEFFAQMFGTIAEGKVWHGQICNRTKGGQFYWMDSTIVPFMDECNKPQSYIAIETDITERNLAERDLRDKKNQLDMVIEGTNAGTWHCDMQTKKVIINDRWAAILGYTREELQPLNIESLRNLCHPDDIRRVTKNLVGHLSGATDMLEVEMRMKHKNGHWVWVHERGKVVQRSDDGKPLTIVGTQNDITRRKLLERDSEQRMQEQSVINNLLEIGMTENKLNEKLNAAFDIVLETRFLELSQKGGIFLAEPGSDIHCLEIGKGVTDSNRASCANVSCAGNQNGNAAPTKEVELSDGLEDSGQCDFNKVADQGNYDLPIIWKNEVLGFLQLYAFDGHENSEKERTFLLTVTGILANMISQSRAQEELRSSRDELEIIAEDLQVAKEQQEENNSTLIRTVAELERFNNLAVGRELRMIELKQEINELTQADGCDAKYIVPSVSCEEPTSVEISNL